MTAATLTQAQRDEIHEAISEATDRIARTLQRADFHELEAELRNDEGETLYTCGDYTADAQATRRIRRSASELHSPEGLLPILRSIAAEHEGELCFLTIESSTGAQRFALAHPSMLNPESEWGTEDRAAIDAAREAEAKACDTCHGEGIYDDGNGESGPHLAFCHCLAGERAWQAHEARRRARDPLTSHTADPQADPGGDESTWANPFDAITHARDLILAALPSSTAHELRIALDALAYAERELPAALLPALADARDIHPGEATLPPQTLAALEGLLQPLITQDNDALLLGTDLRWTLDKRLMGTLTLDMRIA